MSLTFAAPLALAGLLALPLIWLLLRVTPPRPRELFFPPTRILRDLRREKETPAHTPWPLLLLRLAVAAALVFAMAGPAMAPAGIPAVSGKAPLLIALDDGWPAAPAWEKRIARATALIEAAGRSGALVALAPVSDAAAPAPAEATTLLERLRALRPRPLIVDRRAAAAHVVDFAKAHPGARIVWIADGLAQGDAGAFAAALQQAATAGASIEIDADGGAPSALAAPENSAKTLEVAVLRAGDAAKGQGVVLAFDRKGQVLARAPYDFAGARKTSARFDLPVELRNDVALLRLEGERSAGAAALLDAGAQVRRVALVSGGATDETQPLLSPLYYLARALGPFAQTRQARPGDPEPIATLLAEHPNVVALADLSLAPTDVEALSRFVEEGGVLLRFAGPRLANTPDDLLPARLRRAGRVLGGAMSWETPKTLAEFDPTSPFAGLTAPKEITVTRQVLAEPEPGLAAKSWARLADGTPLVTAERRGKGLIALFHVGADTGWSNLPISGLFVDMLKRICAMSGESSAGGGATAGDERLLAPMKGLDGFGDLGAPLAGARPIPAGFTGKADADHPPGLYGAGDAFAAVQTLTADEDISAFDYAASRLPLSGLEAPAPVEFRPALLALAFLGLLADSLIVMKLSGTLRLRAAAFLLAALAAAASAPRDAGAEPQKSTVSQRDRDAALNARLAFVVSGDPRVDDASRAGLEGLSRALAARTSFTPAEPAAIDPAVDELAFYPMLYWPIVATAPQPSAKAAGRIAAYMKQGGTVIFDTRDALSSHPGGAPTPEASWLRALAKNLDIPELEIVPRDHVITKTFYLLDAFVGRYDNGDTWVEALPPDPKEAGASRPVRAADSVSAVVITSNDLAAAWAQDKRGQPLYPLVPGGARQREMALRGGVNLVMYTLTGNYKSDQVHMRDLVERLGQ